MAPRIWAAWAVTNPFGFGPNESIKGAARQLAALFVLKPQPSRPKPPRKITRTNFDLDPLNPVVNLR